MSHYKPYPEYKDSGIEWLGEIPKDWSVRKVAWDMDITIGWTPPTDRDEFYGGDNNWVTIADLSSGQVADTKNKITDAAIANKGAKPVSAGSVLFSFKLSLGEVAILERPAFTNEAIAAFHPVKGISASYWYYAAPVFVPRAGRENVYGSLLLNEDLIRGCRFPLPPIVQQEQIARVIDRETTRIDTLVFKKERFIDLLKERRQSLITQAVTKGLDPNVGVKISGEPWLGDIPEHWDMVASNRLFSESKERAHIEDQHLSATQKYGVIPLAEFERLEGRKVTRAFKNLDQRKHVEVDNFVISMRSFEGGIERVKARGCVRSSYIPLIAGEKAHVGFFAYLFKSTAYIQGLQTTATFIRDGQDLNYNNFRQLKLPCPSIDEQKKIVDFLERSIAYIDRLIEKTQRSTELLKERREALITAAVTGKIDLRSDAESEDDMEVA